MTIESEHDILQLKIIGKIVTETLKLMMKSAKIGMTTEELDEIGKAKLTLCKANSAPMLSYQFPGATCISVNEEVAHGIPGKRVLQNGDLINIDVSAELNGYFADTGGSFVLGDSNPKQVKVMKATREALAAAIDVARAGNPINEIGRAIDKVARKYSLKVIQNLGSHGVGRSLHEYPGFIANYYDPKDKRILKEGQVITIEPFLSTKSSWVEEASDGWTLFGEPGNIAAQYEHTLVITKKKPIVVTL
ncbi:MAG: type I methionyl aminopeptidase [Bacteriovoracaceae bacterium]